MRSRGRQLFAVILLAVCVGAPALETLDRWDHTLQDGNDTEANLVVVVLCVGASFLAATALARLARPSRTATFILQSHFSQHFVTALHDVLTCFDASSPPTTLRI